MWKYESCGSLHVVCLKYAHFDTGDIQIVFSSDVLLSFYICCDTDDMIDGKESKSKTKTETETKIKTDKHECGIITHVGTVHEM